MGFVEDERFKNYSAKCVFLDKYGGVSVDVFKSLNASFNVGDDEENVKSNLNIVQESVSAENIGIINQIHSDIIIKYDGKIHDADGFYTDKGGIFLGIRFADCVPIVLMDTKKHIIMAVHAGWKGSSLGISAKAVQVLKELGSKAEDIIAAIGPHICKNCYEIKQNVAENFEDEFILQKDKKLFLDLGKNNISQLKREGVLEKNIESLGICTYENRDFFSYRRDSICGRNIGGIILTK